MMNMTIWTAFWQFQIVNMMMWQARNINENAPVSASFPKAKWVQKSQTCMFTKKYDENQTEKYEFDKREILVTIDTASAGQISAQ